MIDLYNKELGPYTWQICDGCNYVREHCHFCGEDLTHAEHTHKGCPHGCYDDN